METFFALVTDWTGFSRCGFLRPTPPSNSSCSLLSAGTSLLSAAAGDREHCKLLGNMQFVHIDDVAAAHVFLFECPEAQGRYLCSAADTTIHSLAGFLRGRFPEFHIPDELVGTGGGDVGMEEEEPAIRLSSKKLRSLGFEFKYGLEEMFDGAIQCCKHKGFLEPTHKKEGDEREGKM